MAERQPPSSRGSGDRRPTGSRERGEYQQPAGQSRNTSRPPASQSRVGYRQPAPQSREGYRQPTPQSREGYRQPAPQSREGYRQPAPQSREGYRQPAPQSRESYRQSAPRSGGEDRPRRQTPVRRNDVIRCENCGEDYSVTYKRCPFCDERPSRGGISGRRVANTRGGGYGRPASALKTATWIGSFLVVIAALVIIYRFMGAPIFGGNKDPGGASGSGSQSPGTSTSQPGGDISTPGDASTSDPGPDTPPDPPVTDPPDNPPDNGVPGTVVNASSGLNVRSGPGRSNNVVDSVSNGTQVTVLGEENGWYQISYGENRTGYVSKEFVSTAEAPVTVTPEPEPQPEPEPNGGGTVPVGGQGRVVASGGASIRSGPGTDYDRVASAPDGSTVTILGRENGWYQVRYSGSNTGYIRKDLIVTN